MLGGGGVGLSQRQPGLTESHALLRLLIQHVLNSKIIIMLDLETFEKSIKLIIP